MIRSASGKQPPQHGLTPMASYTCSAVGGKGESIPSARADCSISTASTQLQWHTIIVGLQAPCGSSERAWVPSGLTQFYLNFPTGGEIHASPLSSTAMFLNRFNPGPHSNEFGSVAAVE